VSSAPEISAADVVGPKGGTDGTADPLGTQIAVVSATGSSQSIDLQHANYFGGTRYQSRFVRLIGEGVGVYYFWSNQSSETVDETATGSTNRASQCDYLPSNTPREEKPAGRYLHLKSSAAGKVRVSVVQSDRAPY
jgi:hypothetical protein